MPPRFRPEAIYTPLVTPMKADASFDLDALADVIEHLDIQWTKVFTALFQVDRPAKTTPGP